MSHQYEHEQLAASFTTTTTQHKTKLDELGWDLYYVGEDHSMLTGRTAG